MKKWESARFDFMGGMGMKKVLLFITIAICLLFVCACDPVLPENGITATYTPSNVTVGDKVNIVIQYPETDNTAIARWSEQNIKVLDGPGEVVDNMALIARSKGSIRVLVTAIAECDFGSTTLDKVEYSTEIIIDVTDE